MGGAHNRPVDTGISPYLNIVTNNHVACLRYFFVSAIRLRGKAKAIGTNNGATVNNAIGPHFTFVIDRYIGVNGGAIAYFSVIADVAVGVYFYILTYFYIFAQVAECAEVKIIAIGAVFTYFGLLINTGRFLIGVHGRVQIH